MFIHLQVRRFTLLACFAILVVGAGIARGDTANRQTIVTFSAPVELPGVVLPTGTYQFRVLTTTGTRNIVQVFNEAGTNLFGTFVTIPDFRRAPAPETVIHFEERPSGSPMAVKSWFYPGDTIGVQFVYPESEAKEIAKRTHQNVLSMDDQMKRDISAPAKTGNEASVQELQNTEVTAVTEKGEHVSADKATTQKKQ